MVLFNYDGSHRYKLVYFLKISIVEYLVIDNENYSGENKIAKSYSAFDT